MVAALKRSTDLSKPDRLLGVAAEYATESVPVARRDQRVGEVRGQLVGREFRCAEDVVVLESGKLVGLVSIERLLAADSNAGVEDVMDRDPPTVAPGTDQERAAREEIASPRPRRVPSPSRSGSTAPRQPEASALLRVGSRTTHTCLTQWARPPAIGETASRNSA